MKYRLLKEENYKISNWAGGKTRQLAIYPPASDYIERNFMWRLSSATVELDESTFTNLPDYDRILLVLSGNVILTYNGEKTVKLGELEQDSFDGGWKTRSYGRITDFNLMIHKGCEGTLDVIEPAGEAQFYTQINQSELRHRNHALYCRDGYFIAGLGEETVMVQPGQMLLLDYEEEDRIKYSLMGEGHIIRAEVFCDNLGADGEMPEEIPKERATFDDFKLSMYLANTQFRYADKIFKKIKTTYYDEALRSRISILERTYATFILYLVGLIVFMSLLGQENITESSVLILLIAWTLADIFIVSPLLYFLVLPKPIRKHMKDVSVLTPYELALFEKQKNTNERLEKILKKYQKSGRVNFGRSDEEN